MADVVCIYPKTGFDTPGVTVTLPLAVLGAASGLIPEFKVKIIDQRVTENWQEVLLAELKTKPLCVAISSMTGSQIYYALEVSKFVKENSEVPVLWGGMHATLMAEQTLKHSLIDFVLKGEAETSFLQFVRAAAGDQDMSKVPGLGFKNWWGRIQINPEGEKPDINNLPDIPYNLLDIEDYTTPTQYLYDGIHRLLPFQGSRGCPYKCTFCSEPALTKIYRMMKPEIFVEKTMALVEKYKLDHITFFDEEFFVNTRWATDIARRINGRFSWWVQSRADDLLKVDLKEMEQCGMKIVAPGLESGSNRILKWIKKRETVEQFIQANRKLASTNIIPQYNFIIGYPGETQDELNETVDMALKLMEENPKAVINSFSLLTPLPGTELLDISIRDFGFQAPKTLEEWASISRRQLPTPWQKANREVFKNLMYTSVFANTAKRFAQKKWWAPQFLFDLYSELIKHRWKKHEYKMTPDIKLIEMVHRYYSPVDFRGNAC